MYWCLSETDEKEPYYGIRKVINEISLKKCLQFYTELTCPLKFGDRIDIT